MHDVIAIGAAPCNEDCVQIGTPDYAALARAECQRFIELIRAELGIEPDGAHLFIQSTHHDFGIYYEVACRFDPENEAAINYAFDCEANTPTYWREI